MIGDIPVSFWNFVYAENNRQGATERDKLINFVPSTGYRFDGNGYAILSLKQSQVRPDSQRFNLKLNFKTFAENGLMYLTLNGRSFMSLEMRAGRILYQFDLGEGSTTIATTETFNDGTQHNLEVIRQGKVGVLRVDSAEYRGEVAGDAKTFMPLDQIYFGGHPTSHSFRSVTTQGFEGCIDQVIISDTTIDLSSSTQAFGVMPGCPVRVRHFLRDR